jgi:peptidyl-prolyl cis-trans isomerase C
MRFFVSLAVLSLGALYAQQQQPSPADVEKMKAAAQAAVERAKPAQAPKPQPPAPQQSPIMTLSAETVVAVVDGQPVTAGALRSLVGALSPAQQQQALQNQSQLLQQYGLMKRLAAEGEKNKLDQVSPFREALEMNRMNVLAQAQLSRRFEQVKVSPEEIKAHYDKNQLNYQQARVKAIYIPFSTATVQMGTNAPKPLTLTEEQAKTQAAEIVKQARSGVDFVKLVKEHSKDPNSVAKDGDFGMVARNAPIPEHIKTAIFSAKPGDITEPVRQPNGFYVFRIEEIVPTPLDQAQGAITEELKNTKFSEWMQAQQNSVTIEEKVSSGAPPQPPAAK